MKEPNRKPWYILFSSAIVYELLGYLRRILSHFQMPFAETLSHILIYGGIVYFVLLVMAIVIVQKKYPISRKELRYDKGYMILIDIIIALNVGLCLW